MTFKRVLRLEDKRVGGYVDNDADIMLWERRSRRYKVDRAPYYKQQQNPSNRWLYSKRTLGLRII